jgi:glycosyltransferase involved in cell wall biosynthesis
MKYSIVIPIYNDGYLARAMCEEVARVFSTIAGEKELLFINDGSANDSLETLKGLVADFSFVRVIDLSRNFGQHIALACGFREAKGEIIIRMNVDQQDPPAELPKLIAAVEQDDCDLVVGQYAERKSPLRSKITSFVYFALFRFLTGLDVPHNTSPMRVMSRRFIDAYNRLTEKSRFPQGLDIWLGFKQRYIEIEHRERIDKKSSYTFMKRLRLASDGILYFSDRPIKMVMVFGFIMAVIGAVLGGAIVMAKIMGIQFLPGYASLAVLGLVTFGIQLTSLGLVGLYIGRIFKETQNRPLYLIREVYGKGH